MKNIKIIIIFSLVVMVSLVQCSSLSFEELKEKVNNLALEIIVTKSEAKEEVIALYDAKKLSDSDTSTGHDIDSYIVKISDEDYEKTKRKYEEAKNSYNFLIEDLITFLNFGDVIPEEVFGKLEKSAIKAKDFMNTSKRLRGEQGIWDLLIDGLLSIIDSILSYSEKRIEKEINKLKEQLNQAKWKSFDSIIYEVYGDVPEIDLDDGNDDEEENETNNKNNGNAKNLD